MVKVQRPSRKGVGHQEVSEAQGIPSGMMIWSDLIGNYERSLESSDRNTMQNVPRSMSDEFLIRKAFIAKPGYKFVTSDYDQLEMFLMADFSNDVGMINNIMAGKDIHAGTASLVWGEPYEDIVIAKKKDKDLTERDKQLLEYRQFAKIVGFGQIEAEVKLSSQRGNLSAAA